MFRRLLSTYPKYTIHSPQYKVWARLEKPDKATEYGFKREIVPSDLKCEKPKEKPKEKIWHGWIP